MSCLNAETRSMLDHSVDRFTESEYRFEQCQLIAGGSNEALRETLLPGIISGERRVILAGNETDARGNPYCIGVLAEADDSGFRLSGEKTVVMFAREASELVVSARSSGSRCSPEGIDLFVLRLDTPGVTVKEYPMMDGHRGANVRFDEVTVDASQRLTAAGAAGPLLARVQQGATLMLVAEALGIMETLLAKTLAYTRARKQFGVALASRYIGQQAIQLHGDISMTEELDIRHYFKRLTAFNILLGETKFHIKQIWQQSLAGPATV